MNRLWRVAAYEYRRNVFKKSFIFVILSMPFFIVLSIGMGLMIETLRKDDRPVGIVDQAGIMAATPETARRWSQMQAEPLEFVQFGSEEEALAALQGGEIQVYYLLPADYADTRRVERVYIEPPGENSVWQFFDFLQLNLLAGQPPEVALRAAGGTGVVVRSADGRRLMPQAGPNFGLLMPLFVTMAFLFMLMMSSGYVLSAVADEKENRTMEVLVTSVSPFQLIGGKILGIVAISLTILVSWTAVLLIGLLVARLLGLGWAADLSMDWRPVLTTILIALPSYLLATALMTAIGSTVSTVQEGQSVSAIFFILHLFPLYVSWSFINSPHSTVAVVLSLLPFSSLMTIGMRNLFTIVPGWQVATSFLVQSVCAAGAVWLASRAFRAGMLRYGQRLTLRGLFRA